MKLRVFCAVAVAAATSACVAPPRFDYGNYDNALYAFYKNPANREAFETSLVRAIERGEKNDRLAPGLYAELGYLRFQDGDEDAALELFEKEVRAFPEAAPFMERVIERLSPGDAVADDVAEQGEMTS